MSTLKKSFNNAKDKFEGEAKVAAGKITGDKKMEVKGKIQVVKADIKEKANMVDKKIIKIKDDMADKISDKVDASKGKRKNK